MFHKVAEHIKIHGEEEVVEGVLIGVSHSEGKYFTFFNKKDDLIHVIDTEQEPDQLYLLTTEGQLFPVKAEVIPLHTNRGKGD